MDSSFKNDHLPGPVGFSTLFEISNRPNATAVYSYQYFSIMVSLLRAVAILAMSSLATALPHLEKRACAIINPTIKPNMASGYTALVVMKGLKSPREMVFDQLGQLLVVEQGGGGVRLIKLTDNGGTDVCVSSSKTLINDATVSFPSSMQARY